MRILQIAPQVPFPLDHGGRLSIHGITNYFHQSNHKIDFITYKKDLKNKKAEDDLRLISNSYLLDENPVNSVSGAFFNLFSPVPYNISKFHKNSLEEFLKDYFKNNKPDIIHVDHLHMGWIIELLRKLSKAPVVLREHNLELKIMQRFYEQETNPFIKFYAYLQYKKFLKYEPSLCSKFDCCIFITESDRQDLLKLNQNIKSLSIPAGVDENLLKMKRENLLPKSLAHVGSLNWLPNYDSAKFFVEEILPQIKEKEPEVKLYMYSSGLEKLNVPSDLRNNVIKVGYVDNIWDELSRMQGVVVPLRIGGGMRIKIIEMLAAGIPVISTKVGVEGIEAVNKKHILIANEANNFSYECISLLNGTYDNSVISNSARNLIKEKYTWNIVGHQFEKLYTELIKNN